MGFGLVTIVERRPRQHQRHSGVYAACIPKKQGDAALRVDAWLR
jgi:hypothetical protein